MNKAVTSMKELLMNQGINVIDKSFGCKGGAWIVFNRNHLDDQDLAAAKEFAQNAVKDIESTLNVK